MNNKMVAKELLKMAKELSASDKYLPDAFSDILNHLSEINGELQMILRNQSASNYIKDMAKDMLVMTPKLKKHLLDMIYAEGQEKVGN